MAKVPRPPKEPIAPLAFIDTETGTIDCENKSRRHGYLTVSGCCSERGLSSGLQPAVRLALSESIAALVASHSVCCTALSDSASSLVFCVNGVLSCFGSFARRIVCNNTPTKRAFHRAALTVSGISYQIARLLRRAIRNF